MSSADYASSLARETQGEVGVAMVESAQRCRLCGRELYPSVQCAMPARDDSMVVPEHCRRCHWDAVHAAQGTFAGPLLPAPYDVLAEKVGEWDATPGQPLPEPAE